MRCKNFLKTRHVAGFLLFLQEWVIAVAMKSVHFIVVILAAAMLVLPAYGAARKHDELSCASGKVIGTGAASWYGIELHGQRTASGKVFDMHAMTAAHRTLPFGTKVKVINRRNGRSVVVIVTDRGPYAKGRIIDVSMAAARELGMYRRGTGRVELRRCL
jgi:rare lipoprotein A